MKNEECSMRNAELQTEKHGRFCMSNILTKATVLVLNRNWQAINVRTPIASLPRCEPGM